MKLPFKYKCNGAALSSDALIHARGAAILGLLGHGCRPEVGAGMTNLALPARRQHTLAMGLPNWQGRQKAEAVPSHQTRARANDSLSSSRFTPVSDSWI